MASSELKEIRRIRRSLLALDLHELEHALRRKGGEVVTTAEVEAVRGVRKEQLELLETYETRYLIRRAESWGIEVPYKADWYQRDVDNSGGVELETISDRLNTLGKAVITRQIREARRASVKWWADILVPLMALAIAFLALFKDIIIAFIQANASKP